MSSGNPPARAAGDSSRWFLAAAIIMGGAIVIGETNAAIVGMALVACLFILRDFRAGVFLLVVLYPLSSSPHLPRAIGGVTGLNPLNLLLAATLLAWVLSRHARGHAAAVPVSRLLPAPAWVLYVLPIVLAALNGMRHVGEIPYFFADGGLIGFVDAGGYLRDMLMKPLLLVLFAFLVAAATAQSRAPVRFVLPLLLAVAAMAAMTLDLVIRSGVGFSALANDDARGFLSPLGLHANDLGRLYVVAYALILFTCAQTRELRLRGAMIVAMGLLTVALIMTFSRAAFIGFAIVNVGFLLTRRGMVVPVLLAATMLGFAALLPDAVYQRLGVGWHEGANAANAVSAGRVDLIWKPLLPELERSPLFGNGLGSTLWAPAMRSGGMLPVTHPHNAFLQALLDMGVLGLLALCAYFVHLWRGFRRLAADPALPPEERGFYAGAAVALLGFVLTGFAGSSLIPCPEQIFLWLAVGMMYGRQARADGAPR